MAPRPTSETRNDATRLLARTTPGAGSRRSLADANPRNMAGISSVHAENSGDSGRPTLELAENLQFVTDRINRVLFGGALPDRIVTYNRRAGAKGYFRSDAFQERDGRIVDQIALNPTFIAVTDPYEVLRSITRLCMRQWREKICARAQRGRPGTPGYCDRHWAREMARIGLQPSSTGEPGGRKTGYNIGDYVIEGGPFDLLAREMLIAGEDLAWHDSRSSVAEELGPSMAAGSKGSGGRRHGKHRRQTRAKFTCPKCALNAYAKRSAKLICGTCRLAMPCAGLTSRTDGCSDRRLLGETMECAR